MPLSARARRRAGRFVAAWLLAQLAIPSSWYLRDADDDERFAWRMYSARILVRCRPLFLTENGPVQPLPKLPRVYSNMAAHGNTSAASIPLALDEYVRQGVVKSGDRIAAAGFGAGMTWGAVIFQWGL